MTDRPMTAAAIGTWARSYLAQHLDIPLDEIALESSFNGLGLDSANSVQFALALEELLGIELWPEELEQYPTIATLAAHLAEAKRPA